MKKSQGRIALGLISPAFILFLVFNAYPLLWSLYISFTKWDGFNPVKKFIGFDNYKYLFTNSEFLTSIRVTTIYVVIVTILSTILGFAIAIALQNIKNAYFYRTLFFSPVVTATVAAGVVWQLIFDPFSGIVNKFLAIIHIVGPNWLSDPKYSLQP